MSSPGSAGRPPVASLILVMVAFGFSLVPGAAGMFEFERSAVAAGEIWRVVTSHWTHFGIEHLFWDALAFAVLGAVCERSHRVGFAVCVAVSAVVIPLVVSWNAPQLVTYRGLSGIDSALFAMVVVLIGVRLAREREWGLFAAVMVAGGLFAAKVLFEFITGATLFAQDVAMTPVPMAHVVGGFVGVMTGAACLVVSPIGAWARRGNDRC